MSPARSASARTKPFTFDRSFDDPSKVYLPGEKYGPAIEVKIPKKVPTDTAAETGADDAEPEPDAPPPPPPKKYTDADLEAAKEDGYVEGHTAALEEAETAREHYAADALNLISQGLGGLTEHQDKANAEMGQTAMRMVYAVIEKVVPQHAQANALESVEALVREVLPLVYEEPKLTVRTHNMISEDVQERLNEVCTRSNFNGDITVLPDYELQPGDCRVEWTGGGADRNEDRLWKEIRAIITDNIGAVDVQAMDDAADALENSEHTEESVAAEPGTEDMVEASDPAPASSEPAQATAENVNSAPDAIETVAAETHDDTVSDTTDAAEQHDSNLSAEPQENTESEQLATDDGTSDNEGNGAGKPDTSGL